MNEARQFGQYELVRRIGRGGMGEVWRAKHRLLNRPAAVKLIRTETLSPEGGAEADTLLRRFEREARATSTLESPHTVEIYDFGITDNGTFYYAATRTSAGGRLRRPAAGAVGRGPRTAPGRTSGTGWSSSAVLPRESRRSGSPDR